MAHCLQRGQKVDGPHQLAEASSSLRCGHGDARPLGSQNETHRFPKQAQTEMEA